MNNHDYEKARQECWDALRKELLDGEVQWQPVSRKEIVNFVFDRAYALGKQEKDAGTVIQGWVARDKGRFLGLYSWNPKRGNFAWRGSCMALPINTLPDLIWDSEPEPVEIIIKRKKK